MRILVALVIVVTTSLFAQRPVSRPNPVLWEGDRLHVVEEGTVTLETKDGKQAQILKTSSAAAMYDFYDGKAWYTQIRRGSTPTLSNGTITTLYRREEGGWEADAEFEYDKGVVFHIHPLGNGRYWALATEPGVFVGSDGASSPVAVLAKDTKNKLHLYGLLELDLEKPFFFRNRPVTATLPTPYGSMVWDLMMPLVIRMDGYLVLVMPDAGLLFVFDSETGRFKRKSQVLSGVSEELLTTRYKELAPCVLAAHPTHEGKVLLSTRSEDAVLQAARVYHEYMPTLNNDQDYLRNWNKITELQSLNLKMFPRVVWWTYNPVDGSLHEEAPPQSFPTLIQSREDLNAFRWRFKPDGNLMFLGKLKDEPTQPKATSTAKTSAKKK